MGTETLELRWNKSARVFVPLVRHLPVCEQRYDDNKVYSFIEAKARSKRSHDEYFWLIHHAWLNLREDLKSEFPTEDHLRKRALIHCNYHTQTSISCETRDLAMRVAAFLQPPKWGSIPEGDVGRDAYALVVVAGTVVTKYLPMTQRVKTRRHPEGMDRQTFQDSKDAVVNWICDLIEVTREQLVETAKRAA